MGDNPKMSLKTRSEIIQKASNEVIDKFIHAFNSANSINFGAIALMQGVRL